VKSITEKRKNASEGQWTKTEARHDVRRATALPRVSSPAGAARAAPLDPPPGHPKHVSHLLMSVLVTTALLEEGLAG